MRQIINYLDNMKNRFLSILSVMAALLGAVACEDIMGIIEEVGGDINKITELSITPKQVTIKAEGGQASIAFTAPTVWSASSDADWITIDPSVGKTGDVVVTITALPNTDGKERTTYVTVESGKLSSSATIVQEGAGGSTQPGDSTGVNPGTDPDKWYLIGTFNDWDLTTSVALENLREGLYTVSINLPEKTEFKFVKDQTWEVNLGGTQWGSGNVSPAIKAGETITLQQDGSNLLFNPGGEVTIKLDVVNNTAVLTGGNPDSGGNTQTGTWSVIGTINGTNWDTDYDMDCGGDFYHYTLYYEDGQEFKFRQNHNWSDPDFGYGPIIMPEPAILNGVQGGANITLPWTGYWDVYLTPATGEIQFYPSENAEWQYFLNPDGSVANVTFYSELMETAVSGKVKYYEVNGVRTCKTETAGLGVLGEGTGRDWYFVWYTDSNRIKLPLQPSGFTYESYGEALLCSPYYYYGVFNAQHNPDLGTYWDFIQNKPDSPECYYDGNGGFYFGVAWYLFVEAGGGFNLNSYDVVGEANGYERKDYSGSIYVGSASNGTRNIWFYVGRDIASVRYVFLDEQIDDEEKAQAIAVQLVEGSIAYETLTIDMFQTENGKTYSASVPYTAQVPGYHTVVAVGLDAQGNWHFWYYYWFNLDPVVDTSGYTWSSLGTGTLTEDFITTFFEAESLTWQVEVEQCNDDPTRIRLVYPFDGKYPYNEEGDWATDKSYDIEIMIPDNQHVYFLPQPTGMDWGYGMFSIGSLAGYYIGNGTGVGEVDDSYFGTLVNGVITFPVKGLVVSMADYNDGGWYQANKNGAFKLVLPGADGTAGAAGIGAAGIVRRGVNKASKPLDVPASGNGGGGRAFKARPALERAF